MDLSVSNRYDQIDLIIDNLCLSSIQPLYDEKQINQSLIKSVISVVSSLPDDFPKWNGIDYHLVEADDVEHEDLLNRFDTINQKIEQFCKKNDGNILIHCQNGMSRSATILIAYLLYRDPSKCLYEIIAMIRTKRPSIEPNDGFLIQLSIYGQKNPFRLTDDYIHYESYRLFSEIRQRKLPIGEWIYNDPKLKKQIDRLQLSIPFENRQYRSYRCRRCRCALFTENQLVMIDPNQSDQHSALYPLTILWWMRRNDWNGTGSNNDKIECPKCSTKIGRFQPNTERYHLFELNCAKKMDHSVEMKREIKIPLIISIDKCSIDCMGIN